MPPTVQFDPVTPAQAAGLTWTEDRFGHRLDLGETVYYRVCPSRDAGEGRWLCTCNRRRDFTHHVIWCLTLPAGSTLEQSRAACLAHAASAGFLLSQTTQAHQAAPASTQP